MADEQLEVLIRWEINALRDKLEDQKKDLRSMMIDRNTAALRVVALEKAGLPYPTDVEALETWDRRVGELLQEIEFTRNQIEAWVELLSDLDNPQTLLQIKPMIRTIELQPQQRRGPLP